MPLPIWRALFVSDRAAHVRKTILRILLKFKRNQTFDSLSKTHILLTGSIFERTNTFEQIVCSMFKPSSHPLIEHKLTYLRQPEHYVNFREYSALIQEIGMMLAYEATRDIQLSKFDTEQQDRPGGLRPGRTVSQEHKPVIVPLVRSGLLLAEGIKLVVPTPYVGHLGLFNHPETDQPVEFMSTMPIVDSETNKIPLGDRYYIVADLFIDRGVTAKAAIEALRSYGVPYDCILFITLIISVEAQDLLRQDTGTSQVRYFSARLDTPDDRRLVDYNDSNYRLFRTRPYREKEWGY